LRLGTSREKPAKQFLCIRGGVDFNERAPAPKIAVQNRRHKPIPPKRTHPDCVLFHYAPRKSIGKTAWQRSCLRRALTLLSWIDWAKSHGTNEQGWLFRDDVSPVPEEPDDAAVA